MKILKIAICLLMIASLTLFIVGISLKTPSSHLTDSYFGDSSHIERYVGGDAYNYIIGANLVGAEITGVMIQKAVFIVSGVLLFFFGIALIGIKSYFDEKMISNDTKQTSAIDAISNSTLDETNEAENKLKNIDNAEKIERRAFYRNYDIKEFIVPEKVKYIGASAFSHCSSLKSIFIPHSVIDIGSYAFYCCTSLIEITYQGTIDEWQNITKGESWNYNTGNYLICCSNGFIRRSSL